MTNTLCIHVTDARSSTAALAPPVLLLSPPIPVITLWVEHSTSDYFYQSEPLRPHDTNKLIQLGCTSEVQLNGSDQLRCRCEWEVATTSPEEHWTVCVCVCARLFSCVYFTCFDVFLWLSTNSIYMIISIGVGCLFTCGYYTCCSALMLS